MKKVLVLLLTVCMMISVFSGCSSGESASSDSATSQETSEEVEVVEEQGDPDKIVVRMVCLSTPPSDILVVQDAINEITIPKINVEIELEAVSYANLSTQLAMDMTSGEQIDVFFSNAYSSLLANNQLYDITDYIDEYGTDIVDAVTEEWMVATSVAGRTYAVPLLSGKAMTVMVAMRTDILEKYDLDPQLEMANDITDEITEMNLEELEYIFEVVSENEPDMLTLYYGSGDVGLTGLIEYDALSDSNGVLMGTEGWDVVNLYETDEYYQMLEIVRDWYEKGYIKSDAATDQEGATSYMAAGRLFATFSYSESGLYAQYKASTGYDYTCVKIKMPLMTSSLVSKQVWGVSSTSEYPEASVKFLNLAYSDPDIANLMAYGIEDVHYVLEEDNTVAYPEGVDDTTSPYPSSVYFAVPNGLISYPLSGNPSDINEIMATNNKTSPVSRALGFAFDSSDVSTQSAAVSAVLDEYLPGFKTGSLDLDENYDKFIEKLKAAGMDDLIAEKQTQLDAWCVENGIE